MGLITENKREQHCGARRHGLRLRRRSRRVVFRVVCERDCKAQRYLTWQGKELFSKGEVCRNISGALNDAGQMGVASLPALA